MKIYEIISEQQTQEGLAADILGGIGSLGFKAAKALKGDTPLIKQGAQELADFAKSRNITIAKAAEEKAAIDAAKVNSYARRTGVTPAEAAKQLGHRPDLDAKILAQAKTDSGLRTLGLGKIVGMGKLEMIKEAGKTLASLGLDAAYLYELWQPALDYYNHMSDAEEWVKAGKIPPGYEQFTDVAEWYNAYRQREMQILIGKEVANFAVAKISKIPGKILGGLLGKFGSKELAPALASLGGKLTGTAGLAMFNDSDVAKNIAEAMAGNFFGIQGFIGAKAVQALDALTPEFMKSVKQGPTGDKPTGDKPTGDKPTGNKPSAGQGATPSATPGTTPAAGGQPELLSGFKLAPNASPIAQWKDIGTGWMQDPKTGQRALKAQLN
jgi:hypothetical protein